MVCTEAGTSFPVYPVHVSTGKRSRTVREWFADVSCVRGLMAGLLTICSHALRGQRRCTIAATSNLPPVPIVTSRDNCIRYSLTTAK